jgi:hypothetical protein
MLRNASRCGAACGQVYRGAPISTLLQDEAGVR